MLLSFPFFLSFFLTSFFFFFSPPPAAPLALALPCLLLLTHCDFALLLRSNWKQLYVAVVKGDLAAVKTLLPKCEKLNLNHHHDETGQSLLHIPCSFGKPAVVKRLLEEPTIDVNSCNDRGKTALMLACVNHQPEVVKLLLQQDRIEVNQQASDKVRLNTFKIACGEGNAECVRLLADDPRVNVHHLTHTMLSGDHNR